MEKSLYQKIRKENIKSIDNHKETIKYIEIGRLKRDIDSRYPVVIGMPTSYKMQEAHEKTLKDLTELQKVWDVEASKAFYIVPPYKCIKFLLN